MLREKATYRIIALITLIILLSVAAIGKIHPFFLLTPHQEDQVINQQDSSLGTSEQGDSLSFESSNKPEKKMFAGGDDPNMLKVQKEGESAKKKIDKPSEAKEAIQSSVDLRYGTHKEYIRVVFDGPDDIISKGKVNHNGNEVSVIFTDDEFLLKEKKFPISFRREKNKVIFQKNDLEKIRVNNLSNPSRIAIDFYPKKADSEQNKALNIEENKDVTSEEVNTKKTVLLEKAQPVSKTEEQKVEDQKQDKPVIKATPIVTAKAPAALVIPSASEVIFPTVKPVTMSTVKPVEAEKFQSVAQQNDQKVLVQKQTEPAKKASPSIEVKEPDIVSIPSVPEAEDHPAIKAEAISVETEKSQPVSKTKEQKVAVQEKEEPVTKSIPADAVKVPTVLVVSPIPEVQSTAAIPAEAVKTNTVSSKPSGNPKSVVARELEKEPGPAKVVDGKDSSLVQKMTGVAEPGLKIKEKKERIALLPFDNFSGNYEALDKIMPLIMLQLEDRGYDVIDNKEVEAFLCERRIRHSSSVSREVATELGKNKMVNTVIAGSVLTFSTDGNPKIGILARRLDLKTGHIIWSDFVSLTGEDYTRVLGLGTIKSIDILIPNALNNLFTTFGNRLHEKESNTKYKIAVLPFKNESKHRHAGIIITHLFQNELTNNPMFDPVDYGDVIKKIVNLRVGRKGEVDYNNLQALSKSLGVDVVLTGTVEEYQSGRDYYSPPTVTISARLLDSRRNRILWYDNLQLDGEENIIALDWGRLRSADKVAYGAVSGLVDNIKTEGLLR